MKTKQFKFYYEDGYITNFMSEQAALHWLNGMNEENVKGIKAIEIQETMIRKEAEEFLKKVVD